MRKISFVNIIPALTFRIIFFLHFISASFAFAEKPDSTFATGERGYPWIAHSSVDGFYLMSPTAITPGQPYQVTTYQSFTIQSISMASFHFGLRSRETKAMNFTAPYQDPLQIKLSTTFEILRDYLYVSIAGNIPLSSSTLPLEDSAAIYQSLNDYSPLPYTGFLSPRSVQMAAFGRYTTGSWTNLGGFSYVRPARFDAIPDHPFFPPTYFNLSGRTILETGASRHRFDLRSTFYLTEDNENRYAAHQEGNLIQGRYGYLKSHQRIAWQFGIGVAAKLPDANRKINLNVPLVSQNFSESDNIQRSYGEMALAFAPNPKILWRFQLLPKVLFAANHGEIGYETEAGIAVGLKVWEVHRIRASANFLSGQFSDKQYLGFGIRGEFAFRHLGFQDLEDGGENAER